MTDALQQQQQLVSELRRRAGGALQAPSAVFTVEQQRSVAYLAVALGELGRTLEGRDRLAARSAYAEAFDLFMRVGDRGNATVTALFIGNTIIQVGDRTPSMSEVDEGELWYRRGLEVCLQSDWRKRAMLLGQIGAAFLQRADIVSEQARSIVGKLMKGRLRKAKMSYLAQAESQLVEVLQLLPETAVGELAITHNQLGHLYAGRREYPKALEHYRKAAHYDENRGEHGMAGDDLLESATILAKSGKLADALDYARAAQQSYERAGPKMAQESRRAAALIEALGGVPREGKLEIHMLFFEEDEI